MALASGVGYGEYGNVQAGMGLAVGDYDRDGRLDILKTHFADDVPALYRNLGRRRLRGRRVPASGSAVQNRHVEWGAGLPDLDNDGWPDVVYVTGHVYPEIERHLPQYPHRGPRMVFQGQDGKRFEDVTARSGRAATTAALEPRRRLWRLRRRRRPRRAGHEHERAAVPPAQRDPQRQRAG